MPELPEVETIRRGLASHIQGRIIAAADFFGDRVTRRYLPGPQVLADAVQGCRIHAVQRRGKYLWLVLEPPVGEEFALVIHLGMSGQLLIKDARHPAESHLRAQFDLTGGPPVSHGEREAPGATGTQLRFVDQRTFGSLTGCELIAASGRPDGVPGLIGHIAPDPWEPAYDLPAVVEVMRRRDSAVKRALLDQSLVSGIGNIYADEALWLARVHGERRASSLSRTVLARVLRAAAEVMDRALVAGGTSFDALYVNVNGASGYFDRSLQAYGRAGRPCARCQTPIRRERFTNRSSYSCPKCQPRPRSGVGAERS